MHTLRKGQVKAMDGERSMKALEPDLTCEAPETTEDTTGFHPEESTERPAKRPR